MPLFYLLLFLLANYNKYSYRAKKRIVYILLILTLPIMARCQDNRPHIIFIMTDQHRGDALGCMGNDVIITPHLDNLAKDGVTFVNGYSSVPSCTPARSGLLTGLSPWNHGMLGYGRVARKHRYELPRMLKEAGYYTWDRGKCTGSRKRLCTVSMALWLMKAGAWNRMVLSVTTGTGSN